MTDSQDVTPAPEKKAHKHDHDPISNRAAILRLVVILAIGFGAALFTGNALTVLVVVAIVGMIMVHELGHYLTAKWSGMQVTEFFLGFGPKLWSIRKGETEYGIKAIPAGGYVRITGMSNLEEVATEDEPRTYRQQPYWQRLMVASAGSFMHFVMAFLLLFAVHGIIGIPTTSTIVGKVGPLSNGPSPAQQADLRQGDEIVAINGVTMTKWTEIRNKVRESPGVALTFSVKRDGKVVDLSVTPADERSLASADRRRLEPGDKPTGFLGVETKQVNKVSSIPTALGRSADTMGSASVSVVKRLGDLFSPSGLKSYADRILSSTAPEEAATTGPSAQTAAAGDARFVSPIGLVSYADNAADAGIRQVFALLFSINIFVGIFNLIPLLPFDGGHMAVATYERLRSFGGKRHMVDFRKLLPVSYAVFMVLVLIGVSAIWLDVVNPVTNPYQ